MVDRIISLILRFKLVNIYFLFITVLFLSLLFFGPFNHLEIDKSIRISIVLILSFVLNPPILYSLFPSIRILMWLSFCRNNFVINNPKVDSKLVGLKKLSKLKSKLDFWSKYVPKSVLNAHLLISFFLKSKQSSKILNPTNSPEEDAKHKHILVTINFSNAIMDYVNTYSYESSQDQKDEMLNKCINLLPSTIISNEVRDMITATHKDGEGFLSTLCTLYDLYFCLMLSDNIQTKIKKLFSNTIVNPNEFGWLGHRFLEYIMYQTFKGEEDTKIRVFLNTQLMIFKKEIDIDKKKYLIRNEILRNL